MRLPNLFKARTILRSREIPTPFGRVETPAIELPPIAPPKMEERHFKALGHTIGIDLSRIVGIIPYIGGGLADSLAAMHTQQIKKLLPPDEFDSYVRWDRTYPDAIALLRSRVGK